MADDILIELDDLDLKFPLLFVGRYTGESEPYSNSLYYPQAVQFWKRCGITREQGNENPSAKLLEQSYLSKATSYADELLDYYRVHFSDFKPQYIVRPPTKNIDLQQAVFDKFYKELLWGRNDLSGSFGKNENDEIVLLEGAHELMGDKSNILIVDDVYATGATVERLITLLGLENFYMVVCPLLVVQ